MSIYVGIDLSLVSPGFVVYDGVNDTWKLFAFAQRIRDEGFTSQYNAHTCIRMLPSIPKTESNEIRYEHIRRYLLETVLKPYHGEQTVHIGLENYSFGSVQSGHSYKLVELGGIIKHSLYTIHPRWQITTILQPSGKK